MGTCVAAASLWFLVRWCDSSNWYKAQWRQGVLFLISAALLWRVHLVYWPFYLVMVGYALVRLKMRRTRVVWGRSAVIFTALALALLSLEGRLSPDLPIALPKVLSGTGAFLIAWAARLLRGSTQAASASAAEPTSMATG